MQDPVKSYSGAFTKAIEELEARCMENGLDPVDVIRSMIEALPPAYEKASG